MTPQSQPHKAVISVTGWHTRRQGDHFLNGIWIETPPKAFHSQRLTAWLFPRTDARGALSARLRWTSMYLAKQPNDQQFEVIGRLIRVDLASNFLSVQVYPSLSDTLPFRLQVRATTALCRQVNPEWPAVRLTGSLIGLLLVADHAEYASAPIPGRWSDWGRGRDPSVRSRMGASGTTDQEPLLHQGGASESGRAEP